MLKQTATSVRKRILGMAKESKSAHVGSCLSCVDILTYLYFKEMKEDGNEGSLKDRFLMSKGHGAMALYAVLAERGLIDPSILSGYMKNKGTLPAHLDRFSAEPIEISAGSLGHGLPMGIGMAHGLKLTNDPARVYVMMGDGETQEGSVWEAAMLAPVLKLDNITALIDFNNLQGYGRPCELMHFQPVSKKWEAFGWEVLTIDGHDFADMERAFSSPRLPAKPRVIICRTVKGKGVSFMEDALKWHYFIVTDELYDKAVRELEAAAL